MHVAATNIPTKIRKIPIFFKEKLLRKAIENTVRRSNRKPIFDPAKIIEIKRKKPVEIANVEFIYCFLKSTHIQTRANIRYMLKYPG